MRNLIALVMLVAFLVAIGSGSLSTGWADDKGEKKEVRPQSRLAVEQEATRLRRTIENMKEVWAQHSQVLRAKVEKAKQEIDTHQAALKEGEQDLAERTAQLKARLDHLEGLLARGKLEKAAQPLPPGPARSAGIAEKLDLILKRLEALEEKVERMDVRLKAKAKPR